MFKTDSEMIRTNDTIQGPNDILRGLLNKKDIVCLRKSLQHPNILFFCRWMEEHVIMHLLPQFSFNVFMEDLKSEKVYPICISSYKKEFIRFKARLDVMLNNAGDEKEKIFSSFFNFMFTREVLAFYRKIAEIVAPIIDIDIISISKTLQNHMLNGMQKSLLRALVKSEFAYWSEKFVTSWYENLSNPNKMAISEVPIGPIAEYELMSEVILKTQKNVMNLGSDL